MDAADEPVVLSPALGRVWWGLVVFASVLYTAAMAVVGFRHHRWQFLPVLLALFAVAALMLWWLRRRARVRLADGVLTRQMGRVRIPASDIVDVTTGLGPMGRRSVYVTTRAGNMVPLGLDGPRPHHAVVAMGTIRRWAEAHGSGSRDMVHEPLLPFADGTVLPTSHLPPSLFLVALVGSWVALAVRSFSQGPPWWVLACGAVGTLLCLRALAGAWRRLVRIDGGVLVVRQPARTLHIAATDIAGFDLTPDQYVRVLRTAAPPVRLGIKAGAVPGLVGRLTAWAQAHGGGTGAGVTTSPNSDWIRMAAGMVTMALGLTPLFWGLWPHDVARGYFLVAVSLGSNLFFAWLEAQGSRR